jgi:hypothetical protein
VDFGGQRGTESALTEMQIKQSRLGSKNRQADEKYYMYYLSPEYYTQYLNTRKFYTTNLSRVLLELGDELVIDQARREARNSKARLLEGLWRLNYNAQEAVAMERKRKAVTKDPKRPGATYAARTVGASTLTRLDDVASRWNPSDIDKRLMDFQKSPDFTTAALHKQGVISNASIWKC